MIDDLKNMDPRRLKFFQEELALNNFSDEVNLIIKIKIILLNI